MWRDEQSWKLKQKPVRSQLRWLQVLSRVGFLHFSPHKHGHQGYPLQHPLTQISINKLRGSISCSVSSHRYSEKKKKFWHFQGWLCIVQQNKKREWLTGLKTVSPRPFKAELYPQREERTRRGALLQSVARTRKTIGIRDCCRSSIC